MGADEDKLRAVSAREQRHLRATLAEEPSSSYAYHDEERVERVEHVRPPGAKPANDTGREGASQPPRQRFSKSTMVGGHHAPIPSAAPNVDIRPSRPDVARRKALSEPPEIGSWPPLPNVPDELASTAENASMESDDTEEAVTAPPKRGIVSATPASGAIWGAMPSVVGSASADDKFGPESQPAPSAELEMLGDAPAAVDLVIPELGGPPAPPPVQAPPRESLYRDAELVEIEKLVERGAWDALAKQLSGGSHSAAYRLIHVIAQRETLPSDDKGGGHLTQDAIGAIAELIGVPENSPLALMLAKRLLRRNPVWVQKQPTAGTSFGIVLVGLLVGVGIGWALMQFVL